MFYFVLKGIFCWVRNSKVVPCLEKFCRLLRLPSCYQMQFWPFHPKLSHLTCNWKFEFMILSSFICSMEENAVFYFCNLINQHRFYNYFHLKAKLSLLLFRHTITLLVLNLDFSTIITFLCMNANNYTFYFIFGKLLKHFIKFVNFSIYSFVPFNFALIFIHECM